MDAGRDGVRVWVSWVRGNGRWRGGGRLWRNNVVLMVVGEIEEATSKERKIWKEFFFLS